MSKNTDFVDKQNKYWIENIRIVLALLAVWFIVSFGCGILFREWLDANFPKIGNADFGFWMAQQGSIISFVLLLAAYPFLMGRLDRKYGFENKGSK